jgi:4-amino-4-deoxy-L-arabinose transferase-like glycosyltransferase
MINERRGLQILHGLALILLFPALLINLDLLAFIDDEGIRSLVALEMKLSDNYIVPTLHGAFYYNKPPLYNWYLLLFFQNSGQFTEFTARIPSVVALLAYAGLVFYFFRRHFGPTAAVLNALLLITCGRILLWDSMLGLIDILFSGVVFLQFMVLFQQGEKQNWRAFFLLSYFLVAIGFLLKGLPILVFQALSVSAWLAINRRFKLVFSGAHFAGIGLFLLIVGAYYALYSQYNDLGVVFKTLFTESSKRTAAQYGLGKTIQHLFTFPFEMSYHFFPWSLFIFLAFVPGAWKLIKGHRFVFFLAVMFLVNIPIYWSSVEVYPRYLLMFPPLVFGVLSWLYAHYAETRAWPYRLGQGFVLFLGALIAIGSFAPFLLPQTHTQSHWVLKTLLVAALALGLFTSLIFWEKQRLLTLALMFLVLRIGFNWFVLPDRNANDYGALCRTESKEQGRRWKDQPLFVYRDTPMQWTNSIYLTQARGAIIPIKYRNFAAQDLYIVDPQAYPGALVDTLGSFAVRHGRTRFYIGHVVRPGAN